MRLIAVGAVFLMSMGSAAFAAVCGTTQVPGRHNLTISSGGIDRSAVYYIPSSYKGTEKLPVVFDFHGSNSFPAGQLDRSGWDKVAETNGFIAVALQGSRNGEQPGTFAWNVPGVTADGVLNDEAFIQDAVKLVKQTFCVDPSRIYASGYSGGGRMLSQYICNGNEEFAAAGFVASLRAGYPKRDEDGSWHPDAASCHPAKPISLIAFAGQKDPANPYQGGGKPYWQYSGETALKRWSELDGCKSAVKTVPGSSVTFNSFDGCKGGARLFSYVLADWDHTWPRNTTKFQLVKASTNAPEKLDAATRMWEFFAGQDKQLVVNAVAKGDCLTATTVSSAATAKGTTCSSQPSNKVPSKGLVVEDAL